MRALIASPEDGAVVLSTTSVVALDSTGTVVAARGLRHDAHALAAGTDGSTFLARWSYDPPRPSALHVMKLDGGLALAWSVHLTDRGGSRMFFVHDADRTADGGVVLAGEIGSDAFVIRLNASGAVVWSRVYSASGTNRILSLRTTRDGGVICGGENNQRQWLLKVDASGEVEWQRRARMPGSLTAVAEIDEGYVAAGPRGAHLIFVSTERDGTVRWTAGIEQLDAPAESLVPIGADRLAVSATTPGASVIFDLTREGKIGWSRRLGAGAETGSESHVAPLLAPSGSGLLFAPPVDLLGRNSAHLIRVNAVDGSSSCGSLAPAGLQSIALDIPWDVHDLETRDLSLQSGAFDSWATQEAVTSISADCPSSLGSAALPPPVESRPQSPFTGRMEQEDRQSRYRALLEERRFDELERLAGTFRRERTWSDPMRWELGLLYDAISDEQALPVLREWVAEHPDSVTALLALGRAAHREAVRHRGVGYADSVTETGARKAGAWLDEAARILREAPAAAQEDPNYWRLAVLLARDRGGEDVISVVRRAAARGHHDPETFRIASETRRSVWGGSPQEYRAFAEEAARLTSATLGDALYAWIAYQETANATQHEIMDQHRFDWNRMKRGFEDMIRLAPQWLPSSHRYASMAWYFEDRTAARKLFETSALDWYDGAAGVWGQPARYDHVRSWALRQPETYAGTASSQPQQTPQPAAMVPAPAAERVPASGASVDGSQLKVSDPAELSLMSIPYKDWPVVVMESELVAGGATFRQAAFLVAGRSGVVAVSAAPTLWPSGVERDAIGRLRRQIQTWKMWAPGDTTRVLSVAGVDTPESAGRFQAGVALTIAPVSGALPGFVLRRMEGTVEPKSGRAYIVGCRWSPACEQTIIEAQISGMHTAAGGAVLHLDMPAPIDPQTLRGAAVLNSDGIAIAVVNGRANEPDMHAVSRSIFADALEGVLAPGGQ